MSSTSGSQLSVPARGETSASPTETRCEAPVALSLRDVHKVFAARGDGGKQVVAIDNTSLVVRQGEFIVLLGPSGCGKTTLLRCLAGLEWPDSGHIEIFCRTVYSSEKRIYVPPENRGISMVFQGYALWPHMSVAKNVAYPLRYGVGPKIKTSELNDRVSDALSLVGIGGLENRYPHQLSGGQQQRVALARALVGGSKVILFDEPLSNVDAKVREQLRAEILEMQASIGFTAFYVTHDQAEAMQLADRVAIIDCGKVVQLGPSREVYTQPTNRDTANFIGSMNEVEGQVVSVRGPRVEINTDLGQLMSDDAGAIDLAVGDRVIAAWRPERSILQVKQPSGIPNCWSGSVSGNHFVGAYTEHIVKVGGVTLKHWSYVDDLPVRTDAWLAVEPMHVRLFPLAA